MLHSHDVGAVREAIRARGDVCRLLRSPTGSIHIPDHDIASLRAREAAGEFDGADFEQRTHSFVLGGKVIVVGGVLAGQRGAVSARLNGKYRVALDGLSAVVDGSNLAHDGAAAAPVLSGKVIVTDGPLRGVSGQVIRLLTPHLALVSFGRSSPVHIPVAQLAPVESRRAHARRLAAAKNGEDAWRLHRKRRRQ
jgi:transcription antitermination factor NusG